MAQGASIVGQLLGHYRVLEPIGAGGMGMVFRASDEQLERDVAIKVLPPGMLADEAARKRFRREALTLAKLNHPNIGTVYEFGSQGDLDFLVMEYVGGVAVDAKLAAGPLSQKELLRLGFQLADGLTSAHDQGVIHRDLKPANLRLTQDNRLKILDFGLAQFVRPGTDLGVTASMSEENKVTGTLPYMSPEQLRAENVDQRSDIWAAGVVLYELATGHRPFPQSQVPVLIDAILNREPKRPSELNPKLSPGLEMSILKCLDKDPERRYQSARELRVDLDRLTMPISGVTAGVTVPVPVPAAPHRISTKLLAVIAGGIMCAILAAGAFLYLHRRPAQQGGGQIPNRRRTVAVLDLQNATSRPDVAWLSTGLSKMLTSELAVGEQLRTIPDDDVAQMKMSLSLPDSDLSRQALAQLGKALGADWLVVGSYAALANGKLRMDVRLQDVATGETLLSVPKTGSEGDLFDLIKDAGAQLRAKCNAGQVSAQDELAVRASLPSNNEAAKFYAEGLAKLRVNDGMGARDLLQKAVQLDPNHALAHSALSAAWTLLGYDEKARLAAKNAYDLSTPLGREERLLTEARYREASKEWNNAADIYRTLFGFFPDNLDYGLMLARAQARGGKGKESVATVESLRRLPPPDGIDPRIDLAASLAWRSVGDFKQSAAFAGAAAQKARTLNEKLLLARALYQQGFAMENLDDLNGAVAAIEEASKIYQAVGDRFGQASMMEVTGQVLMDHGDYPAALAKFKDVLAVAREIANRRAEASALNNMGLVLQQQGSSAEARQMFEKAAPVFQEISDQNNYGQTQINIAAAMLDEGDLAGAKKTFEASLSVFRELNDQSSIALAMFGVGMVLDKQGDSAGAEKMIGQAIDMEGANGQSNPSSDKLIVLGDALLHLGDLANARTNYDKALALARAAGDKSNTAYALFGRGGLELKAADFSDAEKDYEEALALRNGLGEKPTIAPTQVALSELQLEQGHTDVAEAEAREARDQLQGTHRNDDLVTATDALADALLAAGKKDEAAKELAKVEGIASKSQNLSVQLGFAVAHARLKAAAHDTGAATNILKSALAKATKAGYLGAQFELRLALAEIDAKSGKSPATRSRIEQLQKEAKDKGFDLIARKAAAL